MANFFLAFEADLTIIPVMNKIDLKVARPDEVLLQMRNVFDIEPESVLKVRNCFSFLIAKRVMLKYDLT